MPLDPLGDVLYDVKLSARVTVRDFRIAILLRDGHSYRSAAAILGCSRHVIHCAVKRLRSDLAR